MSHAAFLIRPMRPDDADAAADLIRAAFASIAPPLAPPPSALRETAETVRAQIEAGGGAVADAQGALAGAVLWDVREGGLYVKRLSVAPEFRRLGVAGALVMASEAVARADRHPRIHAGVRLRLIGNRALFASLGFCETFQHAHDGFTEPTWVEMEKRLT